MLPDKNGRLKGSLIKKTGTLTSPERFTLFAEAAFLFIVCNIQVTGEPSPCHQLHAEDFDALEQVFSWCALGYECLGEVEVGDFAFVFTNCSE